MYVHNSVRNIDKSNDPECYITTPMPEVVSPPFVCSDFLQNLLEKGLSSRDFNESESGLVGGGGPSG